MKLQNEISSVFKLSSRFVRISPDKMRRLVNHIKNYTLKDALLILRFLPHKSSKFLFKLLYPVYKNLNVSSNLDRNAIYITKFTVDDGPFLKRFQPHAQGRGFPIKKRTCHITILLKI